MRRLSQRLVSGLLAPLLLLGGALGVGHALCPGKLGVADAGCPCGPHDAAPAGQDALEAPCCCETLARAPAHAVPLAPGEDARVEAPPAPQPTVVAVALGIVLPPPADASRAIAAGRTQGAGPPVLARTTVLLI